MDITMQFFNALVAYAIPLIPRPLIQKISRRYIAGSTLTTALARVRQLNALGCTVTLDVLGEAISTMEQAKAVADNYIEVLNAVNKHALQANISIKPSAIGLLLDTQQCQHLIERILDVATLHRNAICIDMEDVSCTQKEIALFADLKTRHDNIGLALQAYLQRTYQDIASLALAGNTLRICKGIYVEDRSHLVSDAWHDRRAINRHFLSHVAHCFDAGTFVGVATHDAELIEQVIALAGQKRIDKKHFEFQMLLGVCEPLRDKLLGLDFNVRIYVPFGEDWYGYSTRRLKENPRIAGHVIRAMLGA